MDIVKEKLSSIAAWQQLQKLESLEVWKFRENKVSQLWRNFTSPNFIFLQASKLPSCQTSERKRSAFAPAFTMAEILISLTIIGIIAAITLPALQANINEKTWATKRKALYSRMSQAIALMPSLNGYGVTMNNDGTINIALTRIKATQAFIDEGLSKVLSVKNVCDYQNLKECNIPDKITNMVGTKIDIPQRASGLNTNIYNENYDFCPYTAALETVNGESVAVYYNPTCVSGDVKVFINDENIGWPEGFTAKPYVCANFIYDLNGRKGPNNVGKDIGFMTAVYSVDSEVVSVIPTFISTQHNSMVKKWDEAKKYCRELNKEYRLPNVNEALSLYYNQKLLTNDMLQGWTTSTDTDKAYYFSPNSNAYLFDKNESVSFNCVKH